MTQLFSMLSMEIPEPCLFQVLLPAACQLQIGSVQRACCNFLTKQLHSTNCLGIRQFADTHSCQDLLVRSHQFALSNFADVSNTEEFLLLSFNDVSSWKFLSVFIFAHLRQKYGNWNSQALNIAAAEFSSQRGNQRRRRGTNFQVRNSMGALRPCQQKTVCGAGLFLNDMTNSV